MAGNTFGTRFRITTFGESHGRAIGVVIDGVRPGLPIDTQFIQHELDRRRPGQSRVTTSRNEADQVEILSGVFEGKTTGTPLCMIIWNKDQQPRAYERIKNLFRPGHAGYTYLAKYGISDYRGGGRSSGRETASRVAAGAVAKSYLAKRGIAIYAYTKEVAGVCAQRIDFSQIEKNPLRCPDPEAAKKMERRILRAKKEGDSVGGIVEVVVKNPPVGLGEPVFDKLEADLAKALMSIGAIKGFEVGNGFAAARVKGSQNNDPMYFDKTTNRITFMDIYEVLRPEGRVVMMQIPPAPRGIPVAFEGHYYGRDGESLAPLNLEELERIRFQRTVNDWSAVTLPDVTLQDLDPAAIAKARQEFTKRNPKYKNDISNWDDAKFLAKAKLTIQGKITRAAMILLGKEESEHLLNSAVKIRWNLKSATGNDRDYEVFSIPFILAVEDIQNKVRNLKYRYVRYNALFPEEVKKMVKAFPPGLDRPVGVGVELQADVPRVPAPAEGPQGPRKIHDPPAGNQMVMAAVRPDVLDVDVADPRKKLLERPARVFSDAEEMPQVEVETDRRRAYLGDEFLELPAVLQEEARFGFHQDLHPQFFRRGDDPLQSPVEKG